MPGQWRRCCAGRAPTRVPPDPARGRPPRKARTALREAIATGRASAPLAAILWTRATSFAGDLLPRQPRPCARRVRADEEHLLHRARPRVEALQPGVGRVLHLEARRSLAAADLDAAGDDAGDVGALLDDPVE